MRWGANRAPTDTPDGKSGVGELYSFLIRDNFELVFSLAAGAISLLKKMGIRSVKAGEDSCTNLVMSEGRPDHERRNGKDRRGDIRISMDQTVVADRRLKSDRWD